MLVLQTTTADFPVGYATLALAVATIVLAAVAIINSRDSAKQVAVMDGQLKATHTLIEVAIDQNKILRDEFDASIKPNFKIFLVAVPSRELNEEISSREIAVVAKNTGGALAKDVRMEVKAMDGTVLGTAYHPVLQVDGDVRVNIRHNIANPGSWRVSITGVKDRLDRPQSDIIGLPMAWPP